MGCFQQHMTASEFNDCPGQYMYLQGKQGHDVRINYKHNYIRCYFVKRVCWEIVRYIL